MSDFAERWSLARDEGLRQVALARLVRTRKALTRQSLTERAREWTEVRLDAAELSRVRREREPDEGDPLVTIRIATYSAGERLRRTIESCLAQDYPRVEIVVVGDCCDDATARVALDYADRGVRFVNLGRRGQYPSDRMSLWQVAGVTPMNIGALMAAGSWIAPCDDDDTLTPDHVSTLLAWARTHDAEMVWSDAAMQAEDGTWTTTGGPPLALGRISHGSVLFRSDIAFIDLNRRSYLLDEPADWNLWRRMSKAGVQISYCPQLTYYHYF
ncbi:glycosyltransferase family 2 protein [Nocardioides panacis]|uniref:Glycosyltransferase family 2 protein n=1 Tax=Nocardioides panacis TaxID=2849501 RepID=A0A975SZK6_9ACTN|nr:glycosyltransferase family A protein [Nocardioides panacis]QWZ08139.1 glycosyltransferase family 2 protein [Nocardioides panacis]